MKEYQVLLTPESTQEIRDIHSYIANTLLVPETAKKQISRIMETVKSLKGLTDIGEAGDEKKTLGSGVDQVSPLSSE